MRSTVEDRIGEWRAALSRSHAVRPDDIAELECHLRDQMAELEAAGLADDESFLVAVGRLGKVDRLTAEFAREHGDRLWRQLVLGPPAGADSGDHRRGLVAMLGFAALAAVTIQVARLLAGPDEPALWFWRNLGLWVLPALGGYLAVLRRMRAVPLMAFAAVVVAVAVFANVYPLQSDGDTAVLVALHVPIVLWFVVCAAYLGGNTGGSSRRMDAVRFTGEWVVYFVLIALGGGVLTGLTSLVLTPIAPHALDELVVWLLPSGGAAAAVVAAWLVEAKKDLMENIAPVLAAIFTPLFGAMLVVAVVAYLIAGIGSDFDRELIMVFDAVLLVVLALVLYGLSARDPSRSHPMTDAMTLVTVVAAVVLDALMLGSMVTRIGEAGLTANRVAALGLNVLLIVNLSVTLVVWLRGPRRGAAPRAERWQMAYLPMFGAWAIAVVVVLPPVFDFA